LALREGYLCDLVLWLNDDTLLDRDALEKLVEVLDSEDGKSVAVGPCRSAYGAVTYGGLKRSGFFKPLHLLKMEESDAVRKADTFNGNVVLLSFETQSILGGFPEGFTHLRADLDFGFTCSKMGVKNMVLAGTVAVCEDNTLYKNYLSLRGLSLSARFREIDSPKFGPLIEHIRFSLRHGGVFGIFYALAPIFRALVAR
jgi:GT2 family glycosyltransferase